MDTKKWAFQVKVDNYTRICLTAIAVLLTVVAIGLWAEAPSTGGRLDAAERFLDTSAQRVQMIDQQKLTNRKLDRLIELLTSGKVKVMVTNPTPPVAGAEVNVEKQDLPK